MKLILPVVLTGIFAWFTLAKDSDESPGTELTVPFGSLQQFQSMLEVIAQREGYHGQKILVRGLLSWNGTERALYFSEEAYEKRVPENAIWIVSAGEHDALKRQFKALDRRWVLVSGTYDCTATGNYNLYAGGMKTESISEKEAESWRKVR